MSQEKKKKKGGQEGREEALLAIDGREREEKKRKREKMGKKKKEGVVVNVMASRMTWHCEHKRGEEMKSGLERLSHEQTKGGRSGIGCFAKSWRS